MGEGVDVVGDRAGGGEGEGAALGADPGVLEAEQLGAVAKLLGGMPEFLDGHRTVRGEVHRRPLRAVGAAPGDGESGGEQGGQGDQGAGADR